MNSQIEIMLGQAVQAFQNGSLDRAEKILKNLLQGQPNLLPALQIMGLIRASTANYREAAMYLKKAVKLSPADPSLHYNLAKALSEDGLDIEALPHHEKATQLASNMPEAWLNFSKSLTNLKRFNDALKAIDAALKINPNYSQALSNKGALLTGLGQHAEALNLYERALALSPHSPQTHLNMGVSLKELKRFDEAIAQYDQALKIDPNYADALSNKGNVYEELKRFDEAIAQYDLALQINPRNADALSNKGLILLKQKRFDEARTCCEQQLEMSPKSSRAWLNRGLVYWDEGHHQNALANIDTALKFNPDIAQAWLVRAAIFCELRNYQLGLSSCDRALAIKPEYAEAWDLKGLGLRDLGHYDEALKCFDRAIDYQSDFAQAWSNKGSTLNELKRYEEAGEAFDRALTLNPEFEFLEGHYLNSRLLIGNWQNLNEAIENLCNKVRAGKKVTDPFALLSMVDDPGLHLKAAEIWASNNRNLDGHLESISKVKNSKIKVAYFSGDLRQNHPVSALIIGLFEAHNRDQFELYAFSHSVPQAGDMVRERLKNCFDQFIDTTDMSDIEVAKLARSIGVDIAVDLSGYTHNNRLKIFSYRVAPIQVSYLGYAGTSGEKFIDYLIADRTVIPPESMKYFSEKIAYLPNAYIVDDPKRQISAQVISREDQGLPEGAFIFCCFNNSYKITPDIIRSWSRILKAVDKSVLWLSGNNKIFQHNLILEFAKYQIDASRIIFANRVNLPEDHLARLQLADLFLDTVPYNAHTTAVDALRVGLPLLTYMGRAFAGRVAASLLTAINIPELIAANQDEYESMAVDLAKNPEKLMAIRERLCANRSTTPLFNSEEFARGMEKLYQKMYERYQADLMPDHIDALD